MAVAFFLFCFDRRAVIKMFDLTSRKEASSWVFHPEWPLLAIQ